MFAGDPCDGGSPSQDLYELPHLFPRSLVVRHKEVFPSPAVEMVSGVNPCNAEALWGYGRIVRKYCSCK